MLLICGQFTDFGTIRNPFEINHAILASEFLNGIRLFVECLHLYKCLRNRITFTNFMSDNLLFGLSLKIVHVVHMSI